MNISPNEAEEALATIQQTMQKTHRAYATSGSYIYLLVTGVIWLIGFLATQFLTGAIVPTIWISMSVLGSIVSIVLGVQIGKRYRAPSASVYGKRTILFWILIVLFGVAIIVVARPSDGKQVTVLIILLAMIGQQAMGLLFSFSGYWWPLPIAAMVLVGYYLLPEFFYLWLAILGGGGMITLALYIHWKWGSHGRAE